MRNKSCSNNFEKLRRSSTGSENSFAAFLIVSIEIAASLIALVKASGPVKDYLKALYWQWPFETLQTYQQLYGSI